MMNVITAGSAGCVVSRGGGQREGGIQKINNEGCVPGSGQCVTLHSSQNNVLLNLMKHQGWISPSGFLDKGMSNTYTFIVTCICIHSLKIFHIL